MATDFESNAIRLKDSEQVISLHNHLSLATETSDSAFDADRLKHLDFVSPRPFPWYKVLGDSTLWVTFTLQSDLSELSIFYLTIKNAYLHFAQVFVEVEGKVKTLHQHTYKDVDPENRLMNYPTWKIQVPPTGKTRVFVKIRDQESRTRIASSLKSTSDFIRYSYLELGGATAYVLFLGFVIILILYLTLYSKQYYVLLYASYIFFLALDFLALKGVGQAYLWHGVDFLVNNIRSLSHIFMVITGSLFFSRFYYFRKSAFWVKRFFEYSAYSLIPVAMFYGVHLFTDQFSTFYQYVWIVLRIYMLLVLIVHVYLAIKKVVPYYLSIAFFLPIITFLIQAFFVPDDRFNTITTWLIANIYFVGIGLEVFVWSFYVLGQLVQQKKEQDRLQKGLKKLQQKNDELSEKNQQRQSATNILVLKSKAKVEVDQLVYIKSDGHYVEFHLKDRKRPEIDRNTIKEIQESLPPQSFVRIHRSYIVNMRYIKSIYASKVMLHNGEEISVSRKFKLNLQEVLN
ncbi:MAG: LytTR family transcriptional regulator DNA-binding domain-containing protein [Cyclobacteriaceae bacterium]|nr:LytTR family transcriptional regulator DNA-binding domain-containing protein [Cyclobacteriaceae bacterium HetDA_MAG_MS6]